MSKFLRLGITILGFLFITPLLHAQMRITEYMYDGTDLEFIEFTNTGNAVVDMTGWSYDDDSRVPGTVSLSGFGNVQPGESVILAENSDTAFRRVWGLCPLVKVVGKLATNLGRKDEINLFDASNVLVDRLAYDDQGFPGTIRTTKQSGWVSAAGLGANTIADWTLSTAGDAEGSIVSLGGDVGSPGKSMRATVPFTACPPGAMRITEYMYDGADLEFIEFTNTGTSAVDMNGYSFDDDSRAPGTVSLSGFGMVQPGESVILAENSAAAFRTAWGLCNGVKIVGNLTTNLGRKDEINLFDASNNIIDRLTYGDEDFPGTIRTTKKSGRVSTAGLGANAISEWTLSAVGDAEGSFTSMGGDVGSPGKTIHIAVPFTACDASPGAPVITMDVAATTDDLDEGVAISPISPYAISGVSNDATDPARIAGIDFVISDDTAPVGSLIVSVTSSNLAVVPNANLLLTGTGATRNLKITPGTAGYSNITLTVSDGVLSSSFVIAYAASDATSTSGKWLTGIADASAAIALDDDYMVVANDESNLFYVYKRNASGLPVKTYDFNTGNILALTDGSTGNWKEADVEAGVRSTTLPARTYWLGSMSNSSSFNDKPNRNRIFALDITGTGAATAFTSSGHYTGLRSQLITWGDAHGYDFTASAADGKDPKLIDGFNAEGMVFGPDNTTLYIGFRAPLVPIGTRTKAVIAPIVDFETWFNNGSPAGNAIIDAPIELDLGGRGIRDMIRLPNGNYVIVAGAVDETAAPAIYRWSGNPTDVPLLLNSFDLDGLNAEAVIPVGQGSGTALDQLQIISDNGDNLFYDDGIAAKDLPEDNYKKFNSTIVFSSAGAVLPVHFEYFAATRQANNVRLDWKTGTPDEASSFDLLRSVNGVDFVRIATIPPVRNQSIYQFVDVNAPPTKLYYQLSARDVSGAAFLSTIRSVSGNGTNDLFHIYPNPVTTGKFTIVLNKTGVKRMEVYTNSGTLYKRFVFTETTKDISTAGWTSGYYLLRITAADGTETTEKIILR